MLRRLWPAFLSLAACTVPGGDYGCFVDEHCPNGQACVEGMCAMPTDSDGMDTDPFMPGGKLDLASGGGDLPATCADATLVRTNTGCEFWAADLPNAWLPANAYNYDIAADQQFAVVVANTSESESAVVSAYSGADGSAIETATVAPLHTHTFELPAQSIDPTRNDGGVGYRIESDVPITAYQFQPLDNLVPVYSNDASSLLPSHVLENDYIAITSNGSGVNMYPDGFEAQVYSAGAFVTVVATQNNTSVQFYPTASLVEGAWEGVMLNRGQTFTILSDALLAETVPANLTGTRVIASAPVAVFSGNVTAADPPGWTKCCLDHVEHQMLPIAAWGWRYLVAPPPAPAHPLSDARAVYRVTAAFDGTPLSYPNGTPDGAPTQIDAGDIAMFITDEPVIVESDEDHPIAVGQFLLNSGELGGSLGDPALLLVPAVEQLQPRYVFLTPAGYATNVVTVAYPSGTAVHVDGAEAPNAEDIGTIAGETWRYSKWSLEPGAHVVEADRAVGIAVYGYDETVSYAYAGGSAVELISDVPPIP
jgi:hypothetical protein